MLPLVALTRGALPAVAIVALVQAIADRRRMSRWGGAAALVAYASALSLLWPVVVGLVSSDPGRYFSVADMWASHAVARSWFTLLAGWGPVGWGVVALAPAVLLWVAWRVLPEGTPLVLRAWVVAYPLFILLVTYPSGSLVRYLLLAFPLALLFVRRRPGARWLSPPVLAAAALGVAAQWVWISAFVASSAGPVA